MIHQKKKVLGIIFSALLISAVFLIKNSVGATIDSIGNTITGANINIANMSSYDVSLQFSGTLDVGDIVTIELIDSTGQNISNIFTGLGGETGVTMNFDTTGGVNGLFTMCGNVADSGGTTLPGRPIIDTGLLDIEMPTFSGIVDGTTYTTGVMIEFSDNNPGATATLNGSPYASGDQITGGGAYTFVLTDAVGNSTGASFTINLPDTTPPSITNITSGQYFSGDVTPDIIEANYSGTVVTFSGVDTLYTYTGFTLTGEGYYFITAYDLTGNSGSVGFTIDKTSPTFTGVISGTTYYTGVSIDFFDFYLSGATLSGNVYTSGTLITATGTYEFIVTDLAGNSTGATFTIDTDTTTPVITLNGAATGNLEIYSPYIELGAVWSDNGFTGVATVSGTVNTGVLGPNTIEYYYSDGIHTGTASRTITVVDTSTPIITLNGNSTGNLEIYSTYIELGAVWSDNGFTGTVVIISGSVNTGVLGPNTIEYIYVDSGGNTGTANRTITVVDTSTPIITLNGNSTGNLEIYSPYTELGAIRSDNGFTGVVSIISGTVNTGVLGPYTIEYFYSDGFQTGTASRIITVVDTSTPIITLNGNSTGNLEIYSTYTELGAVRADNEFTGTVSIISGTVNTGVLGPNTIEYYYSDGFQTGTASRIITVVDTSTPIITLNGSTTGNLEIYSTYIELGAVWSDNGFTGVVSIMSGTVNTGVLGPYTIEYYYSDGFQTGTASRTITVVDTTPSTTTDNVTSGRQNSNVTVTLTCNDTGAGCSKVYYTTDGNNPTTGSSYVNTSGSRQFTESIEGDYIIKYMGEDTVGNLETVKTAANHLQLDKTQPTFAGVTSGAYYTTNQSITFDDTHLSGATLDGSPYISGTSISSELTHIFVVTDLAGNSTGATFTIDKTQPTFAGVTSGAYYSGNRSITFGDINLSGATLNGTSINSGYITGANGTYVLIVTDKAGNSTGASFIIDTIQPIFAGVVSGAYYSGDRTITFSDTNLSGATLNGVVYISGTSITGEANYIFIVTDLAGNSTGATFTIDKTQPIFSGVISGAYYSGNVSITFSDNNLSGATLNGIAYTSGTVITIDNTYIFIVTDKAGNSTGATFVLDKTLPIVGTGFISAGNTGVNGTTGYYNGSITIKATMSDALAGISGATCEYSTGSSRASATYTGGGGYCSISGLNPMANISVRFRVQDIAGNMTTGNTGTYIYDITPPVTTPTPNGSTGNADVAVSLARVDAGVGILNTQYCTDITNTCTPSTVGIAPSVTGAASVVTIKYLRYRSTDKLNNIENTGSARFYIDKETPHLTGTTTWSSNNTTNTGYAKIGDTITIIFTSHEALTGIPTMTISGGSLTTGTVTNIGGNNYSGTYVMKAGDTQGLISFNIFMTDLVGNTGTINVIDAIIFDKTAPVGIIITSPTNTSYFQGGTLKTITWNTGTEINFGPQSLILQYSNDGWVTLHSTISTGTADNGSYSRTFPVVDSTLASVRIIATDLAGNTATFTGNQFVIDSTAPTDVAITYPSGGEFLKGGSGYLVTWSGGTDNFLSGKVLEYSAIGIFPGTTIYTDTMNNFSYLWTAPNINSSGVRLRITVTDLGGLNKAGQTASFTVDSTAPTAIVFTDSNSNRRNTSATATGTSTDVLAGLRTTGVVYRTTTAFTGDCDGSAVTTTPPTFTTDGIYTGYACVMDKAGNVRTGQQSYKIDKTAPLVSMGADKTTNTGILIDITVTGDIAGISGYTRTKLSGTGTITFSGATTQDPFVTASTDGTYVLQVIVKDNANNVTTGTINFTRHTIAPVLTGATGVLNTTSQTPNYSFTGNEAGTISYSGSCSSATTTAISGLNTITFNALANATYSGCKLQVTDSAGNASSWLIIPTFTVSYTAPSGGGGGGGGGGLATCLASQLMCVNGTYLAKTGVYCQGGNLNTSCGTDVCVDGDYSGNPSDGLCEDPTKVEATTSTGKYVLFSSPFNKELTDAYFYAYNAKITTVANITWANMTGILIRSNLAKMMSEYAIKILGQTPDTSRKCVFSDMNNQTAEFKKYAITACQLGLMGLKTDGTPATKFDPNDQVNRAIFGTTLSRALRGDTYNGGGNRYTKHLDALYASKIISSKDKPFNRELRGYVMLMMMRADKNIKKSTYLNFTSLRGTTTFVPNTTTTTASQFTTTELDFIKNINKNYQFTEGYTAGQSSAGVKYLQYFLKAKKYYTGSINGINTQATLDALFQFQLDNSIVADENDTGAGYLGPTTREVINPLLKKLLNP